MGRLKRGWKTSMNTQGYNTKRGPRLFWVPPGGETEVVLLDDLPVILNRHKMYIRGDSVASQMRQTCAGMDPDEFPRPCPKDCIVCNAMLRYRQIGRHAQAYLTVIDTRGFVSRKTGKQYKDMKYLLELDRTDKELFEKKREAHGGLSGAVFKVYRTDKKSSPRIGDSWIFQQKVDPLNFFWESPAIAAMIERRKESNPRLAYSDAMWEEEARNLVAPYNYDELMGEYRPEEAELFVAYLTGGQDYGSTAAVQASSGPSRPASPPPRPRTSSPSYSMAPGSVPERAAPSAQAPQQAPQSAPQSGPPTPPSRPSAEPRMPDPQSATAPQRPPPPWDGGGQKTSSGNRYDYETGTQPTSPPRNDSAAAPSRGGWSPTPRLPANDEVSDPGQFPN